MLKLPAADSALRKRLSVGLLLAVALLLLLTAISYFRPDPPQAKTKLGLMTTLPLQWPEGGVAAALDESSEASPAYQRLAKSYEIVPIDSLSALSQNHVRLLLMAQPRALAPAELVRLDAWIRQGGHALILADPALQWESIYPLADKRRPLFTSLLSPLFAHWGLEMFIPANDANPSVIRKLGEQSVRTVSPGEWQMRKSKSANCMLMSDAMLVDCAIGRGRAILVADADLLDARFWAGSGVRAVSGSDDFDNMLWLEKLLGDLEGKSDNIAG